MAQNLLAGKSGYVNTGSANYSFGKWEADIQVKTVQVPNFNGGGFMQRVVGLTDGKVTITGPYDQGNMAFTAGNTYTWTLGLAPSVFLTMPGILQSIKLAEDVEGNPVLTLNVETSGSFTASIT